MTTPSFRDVEQLSAYLDGQLSQAEKTRLEPRIQSDLALAAVLDELRQARALLRRTPKRRLPHSFTLTPRMAGIKPPVPRLVPALSWASAVATFLFIFTLGTNLVGQLSFGGVAPMMAAAPAGMGGGQADNTQSGYDVGGGPPAATEPSTATQPPENGIAPATPTAEAYILTVPEATPPGVARLAEPPFAQKTRHAPVNVWLFVWSGLAVLLVGAAFLVRWLNQQAFKKKLSKK